MQPIRISLALCAVAALSLGACATKPRAVGPQALSETPSTILPETSGPQEPDGAGVARGGQADLAATAGDRVFFAFDSHALGAEARDILARQATWLGRHDVPALIAGSADERGTREYNLALGARRAAAARDFLVAQGVSADRLTTISYGKEQPLDPASNEEAWAKNRNAQTLLQGAR